ncbi:MAG TPA: PIN domain protein [Thermoanaerobaculia bacterium]|nr:PIN domain protein [Thermoanaerobaculia bacterium]
MRRRIYTDTSAIGGCLDEEFSAHSTQLFDRFHAGLDILVLSDLTLAELEGAPPKVREVLQAVPGESVEEITFDSEASELAQEYLAAGVIGPAHLEDARHIATATVMRVDVLVSWNFKHIVNLSRIRGYNSVNLRMGYPVIEIRSPLEVLQHAE